jgi:hypothetical protein
MMLLPLWARLCRVTELDVRWVGNFDSQEECSDIVVTPARPNGWVDGGIYRAMHEHIWNSERPIAKQYLEPLLYRD